MRQDNERQKRRLARSWIAVHDHRRVVDVEQDVGDDANGGREEEDDDNGGDEACRSFLTAEGRRIE